MYCHNGNVTATAVTVRNGQYYTPIMVGDGQCFECLPEAKTIKWGLNHLMLN